MDEEELACFLLANPYHKKKTTNDDKLIGDIDEDIFLLLNKKFPDCTLEQNYHLEIFQMPSRLIAPIHCTSY